MKQIKFDLFPNVSKNIEEMRKKYNSNDYYKNAWNEDKNNIKKDWQAVGEQLRRFGIR